MKLFILMILFWFSFSSLAVELCELQPDSYDGSTQAIRAFEKNIEEKMSAIYQKEYSKIFSALQMTKEIKEAQKLFEGVLASGYRVQDKKAFLDLLQENITSPALFQTKKNELQIKPPFSFIVYRDYAKILGDLKEALENMNEITRPLREPYFLYPPKMDFALRRGKASYGNLQMELFFRPPADDLFVLPILNIGFKTDPSTVIYTCLHFSDFDKSQNILYIYFLKTTKLYEFKVLDLIRNTPLVMRHILTLRGPPRALIAPIPFRANPLEGIVKAKSLGQFLPVGDAVLSEGGFFDFITPLNFLDFTSNLHPLQKMIVDNIDIGIKGILIRSESLKIKYAASTMYGLIDFNLIEQKHKANFSHFMNAMSVKEEKPSASGVDADSK